MHEDIRYTHSYVPFKLKKMIKEKKAGFILKATHYFNFEKGRSRNDRNAEVEPI